MTRHAMAAVAKTPTGRMSNESLASELRAWGRANGMQGGPLRLVDELKGAFGLKLPDVRKGGRLSRSELKRAVEAARGSPGSKETAPR